MVTAPTQLVQRYYQLSKLAKQSNKNSWSKKTVKEFTADSSLRNNHFESRSDS